VTELKVITSIKYWPTSTSWRLSCDLL